MAELPAFPISEDGFEHIAAFFKVLAEPLRLRLLSALMPGERNVAQLIEATHANQANVSKHLRVLLDAGLVSRRKEGNNAYYRVSDPVALRLCEMVCDRQMAFLRARAQAFRDEPPFGAR